LTVLMQIDYLAFVLVVRVDDWRNEFAHSCSSQ
jgi:hypothetical protein